jgi:hypothetical protein
VPRYLLIVTFQISVAAAADTIISCVLTTCSAELASRPLHLPPPTQTVLAISIWEVEMADLLYNDVCLRTLSVPTVVRLVFRIEAHRPEFH